MGASLQIIVIWAMKNIVRWIGSGSESSRTGGKSVKRITSLLEKAQVHQRLTRVELPKPNFEMLLNGNKAQFTVCVEGNIGSGKSTMLNHFSKFTDVETFPEPVKKWQDVNGNNLLSLMYDDPNRWAHTLQAYVQMTMLELHLHPCRAPVKLLERSLYSGRHCFVENLYRSGKMTHVEYNVYCEWYKIITQNLDVGVDLIEARKRINHNFECTTVYLRTDPEILHSRIKQRARSEEQTIPFQYLSDVHNIHEEWLMGQSSSLPAPVLVLDANDPLPTMYTKFEKHACEILCRKLTTCEKEQQEMETSKGIPQSPVKVIN